jgi:hypothetical protein
MLGLGTTTPGEFAEREKMSADELRAFIGGEPDTSVAKH